MNVISVNLLKLYLIYFIFITIGFQQVFVLRFGGSLKLYEVFSLILMFLIIYEAIIKRKLSVTKGSVYTFLFFVVSPLISLILFYVYSHDFRDYYEMYPDATGLRYDASLTPIILFFYFIINWFVINSVITSEEVYRHTNAILRGGLIVATIIALYGLYAAFFSGVLGWVDPIKLLPEYIQYKADQSSYGFRVAGFSQEPSFYVLFQSWVVLFIYFYKNLFSQSVRKVLLIINISALIFTFSSALLGLVVAMIINMFLFSGFQKTILIILAGLFLALLGVAVLPSEMLELVYYVFFYKIQGYLSAPVHTLDSGAFRSFTTRLGIEIFKDYPLFGVGPGTSNFFMHQYVNFLNIEVFGETLKKGSFPQNTYSKVLAEQGLLGFIFLMLFLLTSIISFYRCAKQNYAIRVFFIGSVTTAIMLLSIAPQYSLFIWLFIALGLNNLQWLNYENNN